MPTIRPSDDNGVCRYQAVFDEFSVFALLSVAISLCLLI
jgi:hypothetical protein